MRYERLSDTVISEIRQLRSTGWTASELAAKFKIGKTTVSKYIQGVELSEDAKQLIQSKQGNRNFAEKVDFSQAKSSGSLLYFKKRCSELTQRIRDLEDQLHGKKKQEINLKRFKIGVVAELYVRYIIAKQGLTTLYPTILEEALDLVVISKSGKYYRCEIKATTTDVVGITKTGYSNQKIVSLKYTQEDKIDVFILVDILRENVFICPADFIVKNGKKSLTLKPNSEAWNFKDNYDIFI